MCVLLVDDNLVMQQVMAAALRTAGHEVEAVSDGQAAIARFDACPERFRVLVTDIQLPGARSGRDVAEHVRARRPDLPIILASGDWKALGASWHRDGNFAVLLKPYQARELLRVVGGVTGNADG